MNTLVSPDDAELSKLLRVRNGGSPGSMQIRIMRRLLKDFDGPGESALVIKSAQFQR